ncbi:UDP-glucuronic acid decarboxylase family protein [Rubellimicrobium sp. CFH 75288]|uniref:UDP-glucuronic acid decarboxylase family protein n=1 Tax=Rubellimicrobium sp. CFH 75288 TaxID=2697034 RepID=UPI0014127D87|nr:UDP-glucuronic acid decarboxylase family protein [Rubellimicrobium sp. CFH 75288]NAZ37025.1 NAD-dependent epimerase/dehydratase family protein [Rubellimicrobium sp. CFH 75288]
MSRTARPFADLVPSAPSGTARRILVAGGAGFVGSHLCERLLAAGHLVVCLDNLQTGRLGNVAHLMRDPHFSVLRHDIIEPVVLDGPLDEVWNLACAASPPQYQRDPIHTFRTCIDGTRHLLDLARSREARFLFASTSEVYGDPEQSPQAESYRGAVNVWGPRACYDEGKRAAETLCYEYGRLGADVRVARIFNTYGPRMSPEDGRVVSNFVVQALTGEDITIYGDGSQTRSFCYVDDLVDGLLRLMRSEVRDPVNLGNPVEFTVRDLARLVLDMTGSTSRVVHRALPQDDPRQRRPDISRAMQALGWEPKVPLAAGLSQTIAHFRSELFRPAAAAVQAS